jgi:hypothetical protein
MSIHYSHISRESNRCQSPVFLVVLLGLFAVRLHDHLCECNRLVLLLLVILVLLRLDNLRQSLLQTTRRRLDQLKLLLVVGVHKRSAVRLAQLTIVVLLGVELVGVLGLLRLLLGRLLLLGRSGRGLFHGCGLLLLPPRLEVHAAHALTRHCVERAGLALCRHRSALGGLGLGLLRRHHLGSALLRRLLDLLRRRGRQVGRKVGAHKVVQVQTLTLSDTAEHGGHLTAQDLVKHHSKGRRHLYCCWWLISFTFFACWRAHYTIFLRYIYGTLYDP